MKTLLTASISGALTATLVSALVVGYGVTDKTIDRAGAQASRPAAAVHSEISATALRSSAIDTLATQIDALRRQVAALGAGQAAVKDDHNALAAQLDVQIRELVQRDAATSSRADPDRPVGSDAQPIDEPETGDIDVAAQLDRLVALDNTMFSLQPDPAWEREAIDQLTERLHRAGLENTQLQGVACRGVMCRLEIVHSEDGTVDSLFERDDEIVPWPHKGRIETMAYDSGGTTTVMYVTRDGHAFPENF